MSSMLRQSEVQFNGVERIMPEVKTEDSATDVPSTMPTG